MPRREQDQKNQKTRESQGKRQRKAFQPVSPFRTATTVPRKGLPRGCVLSQTTPGLLPTYTCFGYQITGPNFLLLQLLIKIILIRAASGQIPENSQTEGRQPRPAQPSAPLASETATTALHAVFPQQHAAHCRAETEGHAGPRGSGLVLPQRPSCGSWLSKWPGRVPACPSGPVDHNVHGPSVPSQAGFSACSMDNTPWHKGLELEKRVPPFSLHPPAIAFYFLRKY